METLIRQATEQDIEVLLGLYVELHEFHAHRLTERLRVPGCFGSIQKARVRATLVPFYMALGFRTLKRELVKPC
jgi:hypothetical protein